MSLEPHRPPLTKPLRWIAPALALLVLACHIPPSQPHTVVYVLNTTRSTLKVGADQLEYWTSDRVFVVHGETLRLGVSRQGQSLGTLVITSLVDSAEPANLDAAVNIVDNQFFGLSAAEQSPWIDAEFKATQ
jgi:hypothetical protein